MIKPTVGRVVWFRPSVDDHLLVGAGGDQPLAALVAHVWSDTRVNLAVFDTSGVAHARTSVPLRQGEDRPCDGSYAEWMPYQTGQAAKTEAVQAQLAVQEAGRAAAEVAQGNARASLAVEQSATQISHSSAGTVSGSQTSAGSTNPGSASGCVTTSNFRLAGFGIGGCVRPCDPRFTVDIDLDLIDQFVGRSAQVAFVIQEIRPFIDQWLGRYERGTPGQCV